MFRNKTNDKIGSYVSKKINENFKSTSDFCRAYLKLQNPGYSEEEFKNIKNRISQIKNGKKSIQVYDLPYFCELFGVSCEQILSAGDCYVPNSNRITNYVIAQSKDKELWKRYIQREDKLILNTDEYCKTILDYALEFENYDFLKFLMDNDYIWLVDSNRDTYWGGFGAGTSIERRKVGYIDDLDARMKNQDILRQKMISLAIDRKDCKMLEKLKAREIPSFYHMDYFGICNNEAGSYYNKEMITHIANANQKIITYFTEEFQVKNDRKEDNTFMFPYINELLNMLIKNNNEYLYTILKRCVEHNKKVYNKIEEIKETAIKYFSKLYNQPDMENMKKESAKKQIAQELIYHKAGSIVNIKDIYSKDGIITNLVHIQAKPKDKEISQLIDEVNRYYNRILDFKKITEVQ